MEWCRPTCDRGEMSSRARSCYVIGGVIEARSAMRRGEHVKGKTQGCRTFVRHLTLGASCGYPVLMLKSNMNEPPLRSMRSPITHAARHLLSHTYEKQLTLSRGWQRVDVRAQLLVYSADFASTLMAAILP